VCGLSIIQPTATVTLPHAPRKSTHRSQRQISGCVGILMTTVANVQGAETVYIYIKKTCHEYELDGESQS